jgi:uncharacterized protein (TIGR03067 family)
MCARICMASLQTVLLSFAVVFAVQPGQAGPAEKDQKSLQGKWHVIHIAENGKEADVESGKITLTIDGDKFIIKTESKKEESMFSVDPSKTPKEIDLKIDAMVLARGIYELKGDDLKICSNRNPKKDRPKQFVGDDVNFTLVLKRIKK